MTSNNNPREDYAKVKEQDRWLPIANVEKIMKAALPENAKIAKESKKCMQECVSEFISFITSEASDKCLQENRKIINGDDILLAMASMSFESHAEALKIYLSKYREKSTTLAREGMTKPNDRDEEQCNKDADGEEDETYDWQTKIGGG